MPDPTAERLAALEAQQQHFLELLARITAALEQLTATRPAARPSAGQARQLPLLRRVQ